MEEVLEMFSKYQMLILKFSLIQLLITIKHDILVWSWKNSNRITLDFLKKKKRYTYYNSCPCNNFHKQWCQSKEVYIENMMNRCKFKPCKNTSFGTHIDFWDHCLGKSVSGYTFNYALYRIIEHAYPFAVIGSKKWKNKNHNNQIKKEINRKVSLTYDMFKRILLNINFVYIDG